MVKIPSPGEWILQKIRQCSELSKTVFVSAFIIALMTHMVIFMGDYPNHDGLSNVYSDQNMIGSGRWFLTIACGITSYYTLPWLIGLFSAFYLSISSTLLVSLLEIKDRTTALLVTGLFVTFPSLVSTFAYMFTADGYMLGLMLCIMAVYVTRNYKKGFLYGMILLAFGMGCYQVYLSFAILLCFFLLFLRLIENKDQKLREILKKDFLPLGLMGVGGMGLYFLIQTVLIRIQGASLNDYQGINDLGTQKSAVLDLFFSIKEMYYDFGAFVLSGNILTNNLFSETAIVLLFLLTFILFLKKAVEFKWYRTSGFYIGIVLMLFLYPLGSNAILLVSPNVTYHSIMRYQYVLLPIFMVTLCERYSLKSKNINSVKKWLLLMVSGTLVLNFALTDNISYSNIQKKYEKTYAYCLRLADRMEQTEGYVQGMPIAMIGVVSDESYPDTNITEEVTSNILGAANGISGSVVCYTGKNYQAFFKNYLDITINLADDDTIMDFFYSDVYVKMESFPAASSMQVIDGILVIKTENMY